MVTNYGLILYAIEITQQADILIIIGTSMQVYPAASLVNFAQRETLIYFIDPNPNVQKNDFKHLTIMKETAVNGIPALVLDLIQNHH